MFVLFFLLFVLEENKQTNKNKKKFCLRQVTCKPFTERLEETGRRAACRQAAPPAAEAAWRAWRARAALATAPGRAGYPKAVWTDFWGEFLRSGRPRWPGKAFKNVGREGPHLFEGLPGPPGGRPDLKDAPRKSGQTAFRYPAREGGPGETP